MFSVRNLSALFYLVALLLPAFSCVDGRESSLTYSYQALVFGFMQVFAATFMLTTWFDTAIALMFPWLANISWVLSLSNNQGIKVNPWSVVTLCALIIFFSQPLVIVAGGNGATSILSLKLHSGAYLWGVALMLPIFIKNK